jgi:hypothetical protein
MPEGIAAAPLRRLLADAPSPPSVYVDVLGTPWAASKFPGIETKLLYADPATGMSTLLFRLAPGAVVRCMSTPGWR